MTSDQGKHTGPTWVQQWDPSGTHQPPPRGGAGSRNRKLNPLSNRYRTQETTP